jgi:membrane protein implicated in regulation of membrane protease activity
MTSGTRLLLAFTLAMAIVLGAIVSLATGSWWFLAAAVAVHVIATFTVMALIGGRLREQDKPDPVTEARMIEHGDERHRTHLAT